MKKIIPIILLVCIYVARLYYVNNTEDLLYLPEKEYLSLGEKAELTDSRYSFGKYDLNGYTVSVVNSSVVSTNEFFKNLCNNTKSLSDFELEDESYKKMFFVTLEFDYNSDVSAMDKGMINLMEFQLVGKDYVIDPLIEINEIDGFNPALNGSFVFKVTSGKPFQVDLVYPIKTDYLHGISTRNIEKNPPSIITTRYHTERYLEIF